MVALLIDLRRRQSAQQQPPTGGGSGPGPGPGSGGSGLDPAGNAGSQTAHDNALPNYIWVAVALFVIMAIACGVCARRNHRRQFLYRQAMLNSQRPTPVNQRERQGLMDAAIAAAGIRRPPRTRRRPSQVSVTDLPVYMENPGAHEVVLLQRTVPKEDDTSRPSSLTQPSPVILMPIPNIPPPIASTTPAGGGGVPTSVSPPQSPTSPTFYAPPPGPPPPAQRQASQPQSNPFLPEIVIAPPSTTTSTPPPTIFTSPPRTEHHTS